MTIMKTLQKLNQYEIETKFATLITGGDLIRGLVNNEEEDDLD